MFLTSSFIVEEKPKEDPIFSKDEEDHISTSNKGLFEHDQPNDQTIESPLKKSKKKTLEEKTPIVQRNFVFTKTRATKHVQGKSK
jgi:hypothetical protein